MISKTRHNVDNDDIVTIAIDSKTGEKRSYRRNLYRHIDLT